MTWPFPLPQSLQREGLSEAHPLASWVVVSLHLIRGVPPHSNPQSQRGMHSDPSTSVGWWGTRAGDQGRSRCLQVAKEGLGGSSPSILWPRVMCKAPVIPTRVCVSGEWTHGGGMGKGGKGAGATVNRCGRCGVGRQQEDFTIISSPPLPFLGREGGIRKIRISAKLWGRREEL